MKLLTSEETAQQLGVSTRTLSRWREEGRGPRPVRLEESDRLLRYATTEIERWLQEQQQPETLNANPEDK